MARGTKALTLAVRVLSRAAPILEAVDEELADGTLDVAGVLRIAPLVVEVVAGKELDEVSPELAKLAAVIKRVERETRDGELDAATAVSLAEDFVEAITGKRFDELGVELPAVTLP